MSQMEYHVGHIVELRIQPEGATLLEQIESMKKIGFTFEDIEDDYFYSTDCFRHNGVWYSMSNNEIETETCVATRSSPTTINYNLRTAKKLRPL